MTGNRSSPSVGIYKEVRFVCSHNFILIIIGLFPFTGDGSVIIPECPNDGVIGKVEFFFFISGGVSSLDERNFRLLEGPISLTIAFLTGWDG
jgi:hypothetical protein